MLEKILIIDDDKLTVQIYEDTLKAEGYSVETALSGADSLIAINNNNYSLIITDILLGDTSGIEILKQVKKNSPNTDIVVITGHPDVETALESFKFGATEYLKKPVSGGELLFTIDKIIERKKILNEYETYKRYNDLLQISQKLFMLTDISSLTQASMQNAASYFKADQAIFIKYKDNINKKYKIIGKLNISPELIHSTIENFLNRNTIDISSRTLSLQDKLIGIPIFQSGYVYFLFLLGSKSLEKYYDSSESAKRNFITELEFLQKHISLTLKNIIRLNEAKMLAITDDLTGLRNHRFLESCLENELKDSKKLKHPLSVLFIDIDRFKDVNDTYGHLIGSKILCELGDLMKRSVRDPDKDKIIRYGGDEYVIILSKLDSQGSYLVAERLRKRVENYVFLKSDKKIKLTISIGISSYPETSFTKEEILTLADKALYEAKKISRNAVYLAKDMNL